MATQQKQHQDQMQALQEQNQKLLAALTNSTQIGGNSINIPSFTSFDPSAELWSDYWEHFLTFIGAHSISEEKKAQVFLTNQTNVSYKLLSSYASQLTPPKDINELNINEIVDYMLRM